MDILHRACPSRRRCNPLRRYCTCLYILLFSYLIKKKVISSFGGNYEGRQSEAKKWPQQKEVSTLLLSPPVTVCLTLILSPSICDSLSLPSPPSLPFSLPPPSLSLS